MTTFVNQAYGSHDDKSYSYGEVWFNETIVSHFEYHSVLARDGLGNVHMIYGMRVDARHVFAADLGFSKESNVMISPEGHRIGVTKVLCEGGKVEEYRMGGKYGVAVARHRRTGYVQGAQHSAA